MPTAAPTSRVVSLTAEATPCFSVGTAFMIAEVVGATHKPMPALVIRNGQTRSIYADPTSRERMREQPHRDEEQPERDRNPKADPGQVQMHRRAEHHDRYRQLV